MHKALIALLLTALTVFGNPAGTWRGTLTPESGNEGPALVIISQSGDAYSGSVGPHENERHNFESAKVEGNKISFEVAAGSRVMKFVLTVDGDKMTGEASREQNGDVKKAKLELKREK